MQVRVPGPTLGTQELLFAASSSSSQRGGDLQTSPLWAKLLSLGLPVSSFILKIRHGLSS